MRGPIKGVLEEELKNSLRMKESYERELKKLPRGGSVVKRINGHPYLYVVKRAGGKLRYDYKGRLSGKESQKQSLAKEKRVRYRHLLSRVKRQIRYLKGALRGKEAI